ncbi:hypothetical protein HUT03_03590 [Candidatus Liberibacter africanus]|uniref:hypothetical protein n=1 Tax=Liberibacter africanus TaxID=34020 RepID=UPI000A999042|nr:hypothetical protein [Candidatus Liberibacter africanus]QTP64087.1 hypothetical protein HUT03_03590 [Candidatus Liberibacter africanus]
MDYPFLSQGSPYSDPYVSSPDSVAQTLWKGTKMRHKRGEHTTLLDVSPEFDTYIL